MKNILVGIDFHDKTKMLVDKATEFALAFNAKIWLLHVAAPDPTFVGYEVGPQYIRDFRAQELKDEHKQVLEYVDMLKKQNIEAEGLVIQGQTIDVVVEESEKLKTDLIIFGHHDRGFLYSAFFGSRSSDMLKKTTVPILVVPFGKE